MFGEEAGGHAAQPGRERDRNGGHGAPAWGGFAGGYPIQESRQRFIQVVGYPVVSVRFRRPLPRHVSLRGEEVLQFPRYLFGRVLHHEVSGAGYYLQVRVGQQLVEAEGEGRVEPGVVFTPDDPHQGPH